MKEKLYRIKVEWLSQGLMIVEAKSKKEAGEKVGEHDFIEIFSDEMIGSYKQTSEPEEFEGLEKE